MNGGRIENVYGAPLWVGMVWATAMLCLYAVVLFLWWFINVLSDNKYPLIGKAFTNTAAVFGGLTGLLLVWGIVWTTRFHNPQVTLTRNERNLQKNIPPKWYSVNTYGYNY